MIVLIVLVAVIVVVLICVVVKFSRISNQVAEKPETSRRMNRDEDFIVNLESGIPSDSIADIQEEKLQKDGKLINRPKRVSQLA